MPPGAVSTLPPPVGAVCYNNCVGQFSTLSNRTLKMKLSEHLFAIVEQMKESDARMQQRLDRYVERSQKILKEMDTELDNELE